MSRNRYGSITIKKVIGFNFYDIMVYGFCIIFAITCFYPLWYVFIASLSPFDTVGGSSSMLIYPPEGVSFRYYKIIFTTPDFQKALMISLLKTLSGAFLTIVFTGSLAYAVSKKHVMGMKFFNIYVIFTLFFSGGLIPTYILMSNLHLRNTFLALIILSFVSTGNYIIMRNYFSYSVPSELEDAALIDGANEVVMFFKVIVPISLPMLAAIFLFESVGHWNDWYTYLIYADDDRLRPFVYLLKQMLENPKLQLAGGTNSGKTNAMSMADVPPASLRYTTIMVSIIPILMFYPFLQKYFAKGILIGAVKG